MSDSFEVLEDLSFDAELIVKEGDLVSDSKGKEVYKKNGKVLKVLNEVRTDELKRLGTYLSQRFVPSTVARTASLSSLENYEGLHTVVLQDSFTESLLERLDKSEDGREIGDIVYLLDGMVDEDVVMTDPVLENFNYFGDELKSNDICDIESLKKFPHSFEKGNEVSGFREEVKHMYQDVIVSIEYETDFSMDEAADIFVDTSKYVDEVRLVEGIYIDERPEVQVYEKII